MVQIGPYMAEISSKMVLISSFCIVFIEYGYETINLSISYHFKMIYPPSFPYRLCVDKGNGPHMDEPIQ